MLLPNGIKITSCGIWSLSSVFLPDAVPKIAIFVIGPNSLANLVGESERVEFGHGISIAWMEVVASG